MRSSIPISWTFDPDKENPFLSYKFKRRCPIKYFYIPVECPLMMGCKDGRCPLSHSVLEVIFHPILHKTKKCSLAVKGQCKFEKKCSFYHNENDKLASYLSWMVWQQNWGMCDKNIKTTLSNHGLSNKVVAKVCLMISMRSSARSIPKGALRGKDFIKELEDQLDDLISSCEGDPKITQSQDIAITTV